MNRLSVSARGIEGVLLAAFVMAMGGASVVHGGGISCHFAEIRVSNLQVGRVYVGSRDVTGEPYQVENNTDQPLDFKMVARVPEPSQLQPGYEAIPDPSWITFEKAYFTAESSGIGKTDFYISVPTGPAHVGKKYQVQLGVQTFGGPAFVQMGLMGRALLSVSEDVTPWTKAEQKAQIFSAQMTLQPEAQLAVLSTTSTRVALDNLLEQPFIVRNNGDYPLRCRVEPVEIKETYVYPPPGFVPAPKKLTVKLRSRRFVIPPHSEKVLEGVVRVPKNLLGKSGNYYIVLRAVSEKSPGQVEAYARLFLKGAP
jgi:hypothetical protein